MTKPIPARLRQFRDSHVRLQILVHRYAHACTINDYTLVVNTSCFHRINLRINGRHALLFRSPLIKQWTRFCHLENCAQLCFRWLSFASLEQQVFFSLALFSSVIRRLPVERTTFWVHFRRAEV